MNLQYIKILRRDDGNRVEVSVALSPCTRGVEYVFHVRTAAKGKRTWKDCYDGDGYLYRSLSLGARRVFREAEMLKVISAEELHEAKLELWQSLKPI